MTRRDLLHAGRELRIATLCVAVPFTVGWLLSYPIALRAALRRFTEETL